MGNRRAHSPFYTPAKNGHAAIAKIPRKLEVSRDAAFRYLTTGRPPTEANRATHQSQEQSQSCVHDIVRSNKRLSHPQNTSNSAIACGFSSILQTLK